MNKVLFGFSSLVTLSLFVSLTACESQDKDRIAEAQACINSATPGNVGQCRSLLEGLTTPDSYILRCSIHFVSQGFTARAMATAFDQLARNGSSSTSTMMSYLVFSTRAIADQAYSDCSRSEEASYTTIASFVQVATLAASTAGLISGGAIDRNTPIDMTTAVNSLISDTSTHSTVGAAIQNAYAASCSSAANATSPLCVKIVTAMSAGGSNADIGLRFLNTVLSN